MNGQGLRHLLDPLLSGPLAPYDVECPNAPHAASEHSVEQLTRMLGGLRPRPPQLEWWNSSDDGRAYCGWEESLEVLRQAAATSAEKQMPLGVLGFSQGAAVAAAVAALAERGQFPRLSCVVLVAGFLPRAESLRDLFSPPLQVPSLHVYGEQDPFAKHAPGLLAGFDGAARQELRWPGGHTIPTEPPLADVIGRFLASYLGPMPNASLGV
jgi:predicted esterase